MSFGDEVILHPIDWLVLAFVILVFIMLVYLKQIDEIVRRGVLGRGKSGDQIARLATRVP